MYISDACRQILGDYQRITTRTTVQPRTTQARSKEGHESSYKEDTFSTRDHCKHPYKHHKSCKSLLKPIAYFFWQTSCNNFAIIISFKHKRLEKAFSLRFNQFFFLCRKISHMKCLCGKMKPWSPLGASWDKHLQ